MMTLERAIDRVRKLLKLARSANEHEAAQAAERAAAIMREYSLSEALVRLDDANKAAEPIVERARLDEETPPARRKRVAWKGAIASAVARSVGAKMYWANGDIMAFGRESAVQAWRYTTTYLHVEVERLCDETWERESKEAEAVGQSARTWRNAFRVGAAQAIAIRLDRRTRMAPIEQRLAAERAMQAPVLAYADDERPEGATYTPEQRKQALVLVERDEQEVTEAYEAYGKSRGFRSLSAIGTTSSRTGYSAGREAGQTVHLGGGRGGLPAATPKLRGGRS